MIRYQMIWYDFIVSLEVNFAYSLLRSQKEETFPTWLKAVYYWKEHIHLSRVNLNLWQHSYTYNSRSLPLEY